MFRRMHTKFTPLCQIITNYYVYSMAALLQTTAFTGRTCSVAERRPLPSHAAPAVRMSVRSVRQNLSHAPLMNFYAFWLVTFSG